MKHRKKCFLRAFFFCFKKLILVHIYLFSKVFLSSSSDESTTLVTTQVGVSVVELESNLVVPADDSWRDIHLRGHCRPASSGTALQVCGSKTAPWSSYLWFSVAIIFGLVPVHDFFFFGLCLISQIPLEQWFTKWGAGALWGREELLQGGATCHKFNFFST